MTQGGSWLDRFEKFGDKVAQRVTDMAKDVSHQADSAMTRQAQPPQTEAQRQAANQYRWERAASATWAEPTEAADTTEWIRYDLTDPRSRMSAVSLRHPVEWLAGGTVTWPAAPADSVRYAIGASPTDRSCVVERFGRIDVVSGTFATSTPWRESIPASTPEETIATYVVPRLRPGALVLAVKPVDPRLYTQQPLDPAISYQGYLVNLEYDKAGTAWADELIVVRYQVPAGGGLVTESKSGFAVWSLNASRLLFPGVRATMRAVALSAQTNPEWEGFAASVGAAAPI